ncbi:MAG: hypothetical protein VW338_07550 [Rhodospirillaceae bacterium]|jgi:flagellar biosynthesis/type III secretory pathway chaperone
MDANNRLNDLITVTGRLVELLKRENEALRAHKSSVVHELLDEKTALSRVYENRFKSLAEHPELLAETDQGLRDQLAELAGEVEGLMAENAKLLRAAIEANRRVVELIADAVRNQQPSAGTYSADAVTARDGANASGRRVALSLDQTL